jgi:Mn-dependent DtxR family transcriptional regulator
LTYGVRNQHSAKHTRKTQLVCRILKDDSRVEDDVAYLDAEGIEHHLHPQTIKKLEKLIRILKKIKPDLINELRFSVYREINTL